MNRNILIFPEKDEKYNNILYRFQGNFVDVAKLYYKKTGISLTFVPMYIAPKLNSMYIGKGIRFDSTNSIEEERKIISDYLSGICKFAPCCGECRLFRRAFEKGIR